MATRGMAGKIDEVPFGRQASSYQIMKLNGAQKQITVEMSGGSKIVWSYTSRLSGKTIQVGAPVFEIEGRSVCRVSGLKQISGPHQLAAGIQEFCYSGSYEGLPQLHLDLLVRVAAESPVVRFQYRLRSDKAVHLTKKHGTDALDYMAVSLANFPVCREISMGEFDEGAHCYRLSERPVHESAFENKLNIIGPILVAEGSDTSVLVAYEHGAQAPDTFLTFRLDPTRRVTLSATQGNYWDGQVIEPSHPYETPWMQLAVI
jgi:alpha-galactosidase